MLGDQLAGHLFIDDGRSTLTTGQGKETRKVSAFIEVGLRSGLLELPQSNECNSQMTYEKGQ